MHDSSADYHDYCLEMQSILRFLPSSLQTQPIDVRCKEEAIRVKVATIVCNRPDLARHFFSSDVFDEAAADKMLRHFAEESFLPIATTNKKLFEHRSDKAKLAIVGLINTISSEGLLTPAITLGELELLLTNGNCELTYRCNNQALFSHLLYQMAKHGILPKRNYLQRVCQHSRLVAPENEEGKVMAIYPKKLSALRGNSSESTDEYKFINKVVENLPI